MNKDQNTEQTDEELEHQKRLDHLRARVAQLRDEAVKGRKASGIEQRWREDEEYYEGVDDMNRAEDGYLKPATGDGGLTAARPVTDGTRCSAFFNITAQFVDSAAARAGDILLPANDWNFRIKATPIPEFDEHKADEQPVILGPDGQPISLGQVIQAKLAESSKRVKKAETRIKDWLVECHYKAEYRKAINRSAKVGTGVLKGPFPVNRKTRTVEGDALVIKEEIAPASKEVSCWDIFPDPACGSNIQEGSYLIERDYLTARQLSSLRGMEEEGYIDEAITKVLNEGPGKKNMNTQGEQTSATQDDDRFEVWYFWGDLSRKDLSLLDTDCECEEGDGKSETIPAVVAMVNDTIIKGYISPLHSGEFPFDLMVWQQMDGAPWGIGVARQARTAQKVVLSAARALMDNMGISAIPMIVMLRSALQPVDGDWALKPGKRWFLKESSGVKSAQEAIQPVIIPPMREELHGIIELGLKMAEDATGVISLLQGQQGGAPDTVGGMQLLHQNASAVLRRIARIADDCVTSPHIKRYYHDWVMIHGEDEEKGDATIEALGSTALVERELQTMQLPQVLELSMNPLFQKDPSKVFDEILRAWKFDPGRFDLDDEGRQRMEEFAATQEPEIAPAVQAAQIRAEVALQIEQMKQEAAAQKAATDNETALAKAAMDRDRDTVHIQSQTQRTAVLQEHAMAKLQLDRDLALLKYATQQQVSLEKAKTDLAKTAMKIESVRELAAMEAGSKHLPTPPIEPPGRAEDGKSWQQ